MRIGHGYDVHRFGSDKPLMLCGVEIPSDSGVIAHSDGDIAIHAVCDALLGAAGERDIGILFPDNDAKYENASGESLLKAVMKILAEDGFYLVNCDITIIAEKPRLAAYIPKMKSVLSEITGTENRFNVKATTEEGLGLAGKGIGCHAVCLIESVAGYQKTEKLVNI